MSFEYFDNLLVEHEIEIDTPEVKKPFVLVIDDDPRIREALEFNLERTCRLRFCSNGTDGLQALNKDVETVLLDIKMPGKDGLQVCKEIKEQFPQLPVIFFSAYQSVMEAETLRGEYNPFAYFDKGKEQFEGVIVAIKEAVVYHRQQTAAPSVNQKDQQTDQTQAIRKASVLVIDDDPNVRAALQNSLARKYTVRVCAGGDEGVQAAGETVEAVVLDIKMPGKDGFQVYKEIKAKRPNLPIIFYSGYQDLMESAMISREYAPFAYFDKGGEIQGLLETVEQAVKHYETLKAE